MLEYQQILDEIERLVERLPYHSVKIEVELQDQSLVLTKNRKRQIGFAVNQIPVD